MARRQQTRRVISALFFNRDKMKWVSYGFFIKWNTKQQLKSDKLALHVSTDISQDVLNGKNWVSLM